MGFSWSDLDPVEAIKSAGDKIGNEWNRFEEKALPGDVRDLLNGHWDIVSGVVTLNPDRIGKGATTLWQNDTIRNVGLAVGAFYGIPALAQAGAGSATLSAGEWWGSTLGVTATESGSVAAAETGATTANVSGSTLGGAETGWTVGSAPGYDIPHLAGSTGTGTAGAATNTANISLAQGANMPTTGGQFVTSSALPSTQSMVVNAQIPQAISPAMAAEQGVMFNSTGALAAGGPNAAMETAALEAAANPANYAAAGGAAPSFWNTTPGLVTAMGLTQAGVGAFSGLLAPEPESTYDQQAGKLRADRENFQISRYQPKTAPNPNVRLKTPYGQVSGNNVQQGLLAQQAAPQAAIRRRS